MYKNVCGVNFSIKHILKSREFILLDTFWFFVVFFFLSYNVFNLFLEKEWTNYFNVLSWSKDLYFDLHLFDLISLQSPLEIIWPTLSV